MEYWGNLFVYSTTIFLPFLIFLFYKTRPNHNRLPPGPPGWPLFGNIFDLGTAPHRTIAGLKKKYGPIVWLKTGSVNTMAILTADVANELFKNHDLEFINRSINNAMKSQNYYKSSMAQAPYGVYWRVMRRLCTVEMFVAKRINETVSIRRKCIEALHFWLEKEGNSIQGRSHGVDIARYIFLASFNMLGNLMLSRDLVDPESKEASEFFEAMKGVMEWSGRPNVSDLFTWLAWLDLQGLRKKMDRDLGTAINLAAKFFKARMEERKEGQDDRKDFLNMLLDFEGGKNEPAKLSELEIKIFILEMFFGGSETSSTTVEWALSELLHNPETMTRLKNEISSVIKPGKKFEEDDIDKIPYLQAVIKETLRLHPPFPFLVPRKTVQDTNFMGYSSPKNTRVFVNVWAIGRDEERWEDASRFKPERFVGSNIDYRGQDFEFIPFGAGRRICPGLPLGSRMVHFLLGSLLHEFDLELEPSKSPETMDMNDMIGSVARKVEPLKVRCTKKV